MRSSFTHPISDIDPSVTVTSAAHWHGTRTQLINLHVTSTAAATFGPRCERQGGDVLTAFGGGGALACLGDGEHRGVVPASDHSNREGAERGAPGEERRCLGERRQAFPRTGEAVVQGEQRQESAHQRLSVADHHAEHAVCGRTGRSVGRTPVRAPLAFIYIAHCCHCVCFRSRNVLRHFQNIIVLCILAARGNTSRCLS